MPGQSAALGRPSFRRRRPELRSLDIPAILLFGLPESKDAEGSGAWIPDGIVQQATRVLKDAQPDLIVVTDVLPSANTPTMGHCGVLAADGSVL